MQPNILFTIADDQRYSDLGLVDSYVKTPHLDALAARGTHYTHAFHGGSDSGAVCVPSRAMLMTGRSLFHRNGGCNDPDGNPLPTLPQMLKDAGYTTYGVGKWHNNKPSYARSFTNGDAIFFGGMDDQYKMPIRPFDPTGEYTSDPVAGEGHASDIFTSAAEELLRQHDKSQPFMMYVAYTAPHDPRQSPPEFAEMYVPANVPLPPNFMPEHPFETGELRIRDEMLEAFPRTPEAVRQHIADYYAITTHMDHCIGRLYALIEELGLADNTIIVHTADHGLAVGQHGLMGKQNLYDHSIRVPLIMAGPGIATGEQHGLCYQHDLHPTLLKMCGVQPADGCDFTLLPGTHGANVPRESVFCSYHRPGDDIQHQRCVRDDRWKLIEYGLDGKVLRRQLFDLQNDPWELVDRSADPVCADVLRRLEVDLRDWQQRADDPIVR